MICHEAYVYAGAFICPEHNVCDRLDVSEITLDVMIGLVYEHAKAVQAELDAHPQLPYDGLKGFSIHGAGQGPIDPTLVGKPRFPVLVPRDTEEGKMFSVGEYHFVAGEFLREGSQIKLDHETGRVVTA